jgi:transketolase
MRDAFIKTLFDLASNDSDLMLLTADLGFSVFEEFEEKYPNQYLNVGVAEQSMMGVASGLALEGKKIFTYSIGNFPTLRCLEQIRNDACYHELNINIVASGGGFSYGGLGMSHHATEDLSIMRALPGVVVMAPSMAWEVRRATEELYKYKGVSYLRLDKTQVEKTSNFKEKFQIGKVNTIRAGSDITLIVAGGIAGEAMKASVELSKAGIECRVLSLCTIKPIDVYSIKKACKETSGIVTIEENNLVGGVGSAVAEVCMDNGLTPKIFKRIGITDRYSSIVGDQLFLRKHHQLDSKTIVHFIKNNYYDN